MRNEQCTIGEAIKVMGTEPYGGNPVQVIISPADPNTGLVFKVGKERIPLKNEHIRSSWKLSLAKTLILENPATKLKIRGIEHIIGTFMVYKIENAIIDLDMDPKLTYKIFHPFGIALKNTAIIPYFPDLQRSLCDRIEQVEIVKQGVPRKILRLKEKEKIDTGKLKLEWIKGNEIISKVKTKYTLSNGDAVKGDKEITLIPKEYKPIASARAYFGAPKSKFAPKEFTRKTGIIHSFPMLVSKSVMKFMGNFLYLSYGFGYGANECNSFYPPNSEQEWRYKEMMKDEIACHGIIDRTGDFFKRLDLTFNARPAGMKLTCEYAGHRDCHDFIRACQNNKEYKNKFYIES